MAVDRLGVELFRPKIIDVGQQLFVSKLWVYLGIVQCAVTKGCIWVFRNLYETICLFIQRVFNTHHNMHQNFIIYHFKFLGNQ